MRTMDTSYLALLLAREAKDSNDEYRGRHTDTKDAMDTKYQGHRGLAGEQQEGHNTRSIRMVLGLEEDEVLLVGLHEIATDARLQVQGFEPQRGARDPRREGAVLQGANRLQTDL